MVKRIKLMADYESYPLWWVDSYEVGNIDPETLPLKTETISRLNIWAKVYDSSLNLDDPLSSGFSTQEEENAFEAEGIKLWSQLQEELRDGYQVFYYSYMLTKLLKDFSQLN